MRATEFMKEAARHTKYDFHREPDNWFVVTANGEEIGRFQGKSQFDSGAAQDAAKKCIAQHRAAAINAEDKIKYDEIQFNKPLSPLELEWIGLEKKFRTDYKSLSDKEVNRWEQLHQILRKSLIDGTHPAVKEFRKL